MIKLSTLFPTALLMVFVGASLTAQAQTTAPADSLRAPVKSQLNTLPPATQPRTPIAPSLTPDKLMATPPPLTLGLSLGWGAPYGVGLEMAYRFRPTFDGNVGVGIGSSGAKIGAGARAYLPSRTRNQFFVGANLVYSYADIELDTETNGVKGRYRLNSSTLLHLRGGLHHQFRRNALQVAVGYGAVLSPHPAIEFVPGYGPGSGTSQKIMEIVGPGGLEVSLSFLFGLGRSPLTVRH